MKVVGRNESAFATVPTIIMKGTEVQTLGELRMRGSLIDGLGFICLYSWYPASSSRRVWHGLATVVDSDTCPSL